MPLSGEQATPASPSSQRSLLASVLVAWVSCAAAVATLKIQHQRGIQHFEPLAFLLPLTAQAGAIVIASGLALTNLARRRRPGRSALLGAIALASATLWVATAIYGFGNWSVRHVPNDFLMNLAKRAGASLMEAQAAWAFPQRHESARVVMFHHGVTDPDDDLWAMENHLSHLESLLDGPLRTRIHWVRGRLLGFHGLSLYGLAVWEPQPNPENGEIHFDPVDRHEAAHAAIAQFLPPDADVPTVLSEGWAQAHQNGWLGPRPVREADIWADYRSISETGDPTPRLAELFGPAWYHQDSGAVYPLGAHLVRYLISRYGAPKFLTLYKSIRPGQVEATFQRLYGMTPAEIEAAMETEAQNSIRK